MPEYPAKTTPQVTGNFLTYPGQDLKNLIDPSVEGCEAKNNGIANFVTLYRGLHGKKMKTSVEL